MTENKEFSRAKGLDFAFHQVKVEERGGVIEIDVRQSFTNESKIAVLMFKSGKFPDGVKLSSELRFDAERWRIAWSTGNDAAFASLLREPFRTIVLSPLGKAKGWRDSARLRAEAIETWRNTPQRALGGRTPRQIVDKSGPIEILEIGYVWIGHTRDGLVIQSRSYYKSKVLNRDLLWYLSRGTSLGEAIGLVTAQWQSINRQMLAAWIQTMHGVAGASKGSASHDYWRMRDDVRKELAKKAGFLQDTGDLVDKIGPSAFIDQRTEGRIQTLAKRNPVPVPQLVPLGLPILVKKFLGAL